MGWKCWKWDGRQHRVTDHVRASGARFNATPNPNGRFFFFPSLLSGLLNKNCLVVVNQNFLIAAQEFTLPQVMTF